MLYEINQLPRRRGFHSDFMNGFTGKDIFTDYNEEAKPNRARGSYPAVNIIENKSNYEIELAAPGLCRDDYEIVLEKDVLKVISEKNSNEISSDSRYTRREYASGQFEKSFILPENADREAIAASCSDGILNIRLPKMELNKNPEKRKIDVR